MRLMYQGGRECWPRDFHDQMFLGQAIGLANRIMHDTAMLDVTDGFDLMTIDPKVARDVTRSEEDQAQAFQRAQKARSAIGGALATGEIAAYRLIAGSGFEPLDKAIWAIVDDGNARSFPAALYTFASGDDFIYVDRAATLVLLDNIRRHVGGTLGAVRDFPEPILPLLEGAPSRGLYWEYLSALVWAITASQEAADGADRYFEHMAKHGFAASQSALLTLLQDEIPNHHCRCLKPICSCIEDEKVALRTLLRAGGLQALGHKNDQGDLQPIPVEAWSGGTLTIADMVVLEPAKPGGTRWTDVCFRRADFMRVGLVAKIATATTSSGSPKGPGRGRRAGTAKDDSQHLAAMHAMVAAGSTAWEAAGSIAQRPGVEGGGTFEAKQKRLHTKYQAYRRDLS